jgi:hypothetical protein
VAKLALFEGGYQHRKIKFGTYFFMNASRVAWLGNLDANE